PWRTLQHAADRVTAGVTVIVNPGSYAGFAVGWDAPRAGTADAPIRFLAQPGAVIWAPNPETGDGIDVEEGCDYVTVQGFEVDAVPAAGIRLDGSAHVS